MTQTTEPPPTDADLRSLAFFEHYYCIDLGDGSMLHAAACCTTRIREAAERELSRMPSYYILPEGAQSMYGPIDR